VIYRISSYRARAAYFPLEIRRQQKCMSISLLVFFFLSYCIIVTSSERVAPSHVILYQYYYGYTYRTSPPERHLYNITLFTIAVHILYCHICPVSYTASRLNAKRISIRRRSTIKTISTNSNRIRTMYTNGWKFSPPPLIRVGYCVRPRAVNRYRHRQYV